MTIGSEGTRTSLKKINQNFEIQEFQVYILGYIFYSQLSRIDWKFWEGVAT